MSFIREYGGTILVCLILAGLVTAIVIKLIRDKRKGKSCCGGCDGCAAKDMCHKK